MAGCEAIVPPVEWDHRRVSAGAWLAGITVSVLAPVRELSCSDVGQLSCVCACAGPVNGTTSQASRTADPTTHAIQKRRIARLLVSLPAELHSVAGVDRGAVPLGQVSENAPHRHDLVPPPDLHPGRFRVDDAVFCDVPVEPEPGDKELDDALPHRIAGEEP